MVINIFPKHSQSNFYSTIRIFILLIFSLVNCVNATEVRKIPGYRGIWFTLGQFSDYGDKYSGGLGTYTAKHVPLAVYAPQVDKTFFVYGGTTDPDSRHLLAMVSYYDHKKNLVPQPTVVHDKQGVNDPHDNPSISIDENGFIWIFVSGRARKRPGYIYKSLSTYDINGFELILEREFAYPQPWWIEGKGFFWCFTKYTKGRELYWATSLDGKNWTDDQKLVEGGHYQITNVNNGRLITAFNSHPNNSYVDGRTNLYFLQSGNFGNSWETVQGEKVETPLNSFDNPALVRDYQKEGRLVYMKDINFDRNGHPIILYITSNSHQPGPKGGIRIWEVAHWTGDEWDFRKITVASHNYDMGSLYVENDGWRVIAPTAVGPHGFGTGGEMAVWFTEDGKVWQQKRRITRDSERNQAYARRSVNAHSDFYAFWADGNPNQMSISKLYFTNKEGDKVWQLPYDMIEEFEQPKPVK